MNYSANTKSLICYPIIKAQFILPKTISSINELNTLTFDITSFVNTLKMEILLLSIVLRKTWRPTFSPRLFPRWSRNISHHHLDLLICNCPFVRNDFKLMTIHDSPIGLNLTLLFFKLYEYSLVCGGVLKYFHVLSWFSKCAPSLGDAVATALLTYVRWLIQLIAYWSDCGLFSINHTAYS